MSVVVEGASKPQHLRALDRANRIRLGRAQLKREIRAGRKTVAEVVREMPEEMETITLAELLTAQARWGRTRARKFLFPLSLSETKKLGTLTPRQLALFRAELERQGK